MVAPCVCLSLCFLASCERQAPKAVHRAGQTAPLPHEAGAVMQSLEPIDVVRRVHELRVARRWFELTDHIVPEQREAAAHLIRATDALLDANDHLQQTVAQRFGPAAAMPFDRSAAGDAIGVFSLHIRALTQRVEGDRATVTIQVADRVPLDSVELLRRNGRWLLRTDPPIPGVPEALEDLARVLREVAEDVQGGVIPSTEAVENELARRQRPVLRRLAQLTRAADR